MDGLPSPPPPEIVKDANTAAAVSLLSRETLAGRVEKKDACRAAVSDDAYTTRWPHAMPSAANNRDSTSAWEPSASSSTSTSVPSGSPPPKKLSSVVWPDDTSHGPSIQRRAPGRGPALPSEAGVGVVAGEAARLAVVLLLLPTCGRRGAARLKLDMMRPPSDVAKGRHNETTNKPGP